VTLEIYTRAASEADRAADTEEAAGG